MTEWTELHGSLLGSAFARVLGKPDRGAMAFVRCRTADVVERLARDPSFSPSEWRVWRVADADDAKARTITADRAVEVRESKVDAVLLLVDTGRAGAGMDGIYSAAQEVDESSLFSEARRLAAHTLAREARERAERALKRARGFGGRISMSHWTEFDFLVRIAAAKRDPGELLYLLGLWPAKEDSTADRERVLDYDAYVIDCVPEREDLGCLQLITSTSNLEEVRNLLDSALDQMGLSQSRRNAEFLLEHLKALSGRLAIRLTGQKAPTAELIALALSHANCRPAPDGGVCWTPLRTGFLIPVDDVLDLIPPLMDNRRGESATEARPDLIYVSLAPRRALLFQFIEVKYRRHLRAARSAEVLDAIREQIASLRERWDAWYSDEGAPAAFRAVRRAKLARVLRFYADKARRHHLAHEPYDALVAEIDRMIEKGGDYTFGAGEAPDRGWVFCSEYGGTNPLELSTAEWDTRIFLFGPGLLPDSEFGQEIIEPDADAAADGDATIVRPVNGEYSPHYQPTDVRGGENSEAGEESPEDQDVARSVHTAGTEGPPAIVLGTDSLTGTDVPWPLTIKGNPHLLVAGLPGMGKTTCLLNLCQQMREAGVRTIVFSYHQDIDERLQQLAGAIRFIDYHGLGFNPLQVIDRDSRMAYLDVAGALRDIFVAIYPELGDIQGERIRKAIKESFLEQGWGDPNTDAAGLQAPLFARFVEILRADPRPDRGLRTLLGRLEELADYGFFDLAGSHESLWDSEHPIIIRIHGTQNDNLQKAFASLVFYGLYKDMFRRGIQDRITHAVVFDEAHRAARLRLIPTMAKECRKYGISLVLASQEAKDFNISLFSAIANYLVLRLNEADAKALVRNVASSDQERALIDKIKQMERFRALYFCEGKKRPSPVSLRAT